MDKPCDICGDKGVIEAIITCCDCKTSRQHLYCMRVVTTEAPPFWLCEECERKKLFSPTTTSTQNILIQKNTKVVSKCPIKTGFASRFNFKEKRVDKGRTKYISCEEAVKLSSGATKEDEEPSRTKSLSKIYGATKFEPPVVQKSIVMKDSVKSTKSSARVERTNTESFSATSPTKEDDMKKHIEVPKSSKKLKESITKEDDMKNHNEVPKSSKRLKESITQEDDMKKHNEVPKSSKKLKESITQEDDMRKHIEVPKSFKKLEETITQESTVMVKTEVIIPKKEEADIHVPKSFIKVENTNSKTDEGPNVTMGDPVSEMHDTSIPALHSYWKGSFYLPNGHENLNGAFKAHPPSSVHNKVYETLNKMPENIYFELAPINQVLVDLFKGDCPYKDDIGLYFFPRFTKRDDEDCNSLVDFLWSKNMVMKSFVDEVELFVLSSRYLQLQSQEFEGSYFLWGVFRPNKVKKGGASSKSKSIIVHESSGQRGVMDSIESMRADFPPGFEKCRSLLLQSQ